MSSHQKNCIWDHLDVAALSRGPTPTAEISVRLSRKIVLSESGCWLWLGAANRRGYGRVWKDGKSVGAHRASFEVFCEPIPDGMHLDHLCRTPCCINPLHLEPVTPGENQDRGLFYKFKKRSKERIEKLRLNKLP